MYSLSSLAAAKNQAGTCDLKHKNDIYTDSEVVIDICKYNVGTFTK